MAAQTYTAERPGPLVLDVSLVAGLVRVSVEDRPTAEITVSTDQASGPAADAVRAARFTEVADRLTVRVPQPNGSGPVTQAVRTGRGMTVVNINSGGNVGVMAGVVYGGMSMVNGAVTVGGHATVAGSAITVDVRLPHGSSLVAATTSADVETAGTLTAVEVHTVSGDVQVDGTGQAWLTSTSGDLRIDRFAGTSPQARLKTVSGDIRVHATSADGFVQARSVSGDIRVTGRPVGLDARTVSGRTTNR